MKLEGSCHCGAVAFTVSATAPAPYLRCYCSICRKTAGGGGYAINLGAQFDTLTVSGSEAISVFHAMIDGTKSPAERRFCKHCGSALWVWDPGWPDLVHPFASAIDTPLPPAPEHVHIMLDAKPTWVPLEAKEGEECTAAYPSQSLVEWHESHNLAG